MPTISLAAYGAILSTFGIAWQIWKAWSERRWITTSYNFRGIEEPGNEVLLINNSPKPITLFNTELFWGRRVLWFIRRYRRIGCDPWGEEDSDTGVTLDPYKITTFYYSGDRHFNWRYDKRPGAKIYLYARVVGQRCPIVLLVFRQDNWAPRWFRRQLVRIGFPYRPYRTYLDDPQTSGIDILEDMPSEPEGPKSQEPNRG